MPLSYTIDSAKRLLLITGSGGLSPGDILTGREAMAADPKIQPGMRILVDLRALADVEMAGREVMDLARSRESLAFLSAENRTAIVVSDATAFARARMYFLSRRASSEPMAVFYHMDEAAQWLGLEPPELDSAGGA